jgi:transposase
MGLPRPSRQIGDRSAWPALSSSIRSRLAADRVRLLNQVRGLLGEHGVVVAKDIGNLRRALARIVGDDENRVLNPLVRALMAELREELTQLDARIAGFDRKIRELYRNTEICQRLGKVEGIGPVTATALVAAVGDRSSFKNGRQLRRGLALCPSSDQVAAAPDYSVSANGEIAICAHC